jgi:hypothetical protein
MFMFLYDINIDHESIDAGICEDYGIELKLYWNLSHFCFFIAILNSILIPILNLIQIIFFNNYS